MKTQKIFNASFLVTMLFFLSSTVNAQIVGPSSARVGQSAQYTLTSNTDYSSWDFTVSHGTVISKNKTSCSGCGGGGVVPMQSVHSFAASSIITPPGTVTYTYTANVSWTSTGIGTVNFIVSGISNASLQVTICTVPVTPSGITFGVSTNSCGDKIVTYSGATNPSWYWQTSPTGTSLLSSGNTFSAPASGIYYLRTYQCGSWSGALATPSISVTPLPAAPGPLLASTNTCGVKILSYTGTPSVGVNWYWQGTNTAGIDRSSPTALASTFSVSNSGTYYLGSVSAAGCWNYKSINVAVDNAPPPPATSATYCEWDQFNLTTPQTASSINWYAESGSLVHQGLTYSLQNLNIGTYRFNMKSVSATGCEGLSSNIFTLNISSSCDDRLNWNESILYTIDPSTGQSVPVADNRSYQDGMGTEIQSQSKSYSANQILATERIFDNLGGAVVETLPAPINASDFGYRYRFTTSSLSGNPKYSWNDFDLSSGPGNISSPNAVNDNGPGSLGWYYGLSNTMEPFTPSTFYPYTRSYSVPGPDPIATRIAKPGNSFRMGAGHESITERLIISPGDLAHYATIQTYFTNDRDMLSLAKPASQNLSSFALTGAAITAVNEFVKITCNTTSGTPGVTSIKGTLAVVPNTTYNVRIKGYKSSAQQVDIIVTTATGNNILWPGPALPTGGTNEAWTSAVFTVPPGVTSLKIGAQWAQPVIGDTFFISDVILIPATPISGYKYISTDEDGKKVATFSDAEGRSIASARVVATSPNYSFDTWTYYFFNKIGQIIAKVSPQGVNPTSTNYPAFVTNYTYDHLGRTVAISSIDEGTMQYVYRSDGLLRFSQNAEQAKASPKRFSYINYDILGRRIESGEYSGSQYVFESAATKAIASGSILKASILENTGFSGTINNLDIAGCGNSSKTYFQKIDSSPDPNHTDQTFINGAAFKTSNATSSTWYSFDEAGRLRWTVQQIVGLGIKSTDYQYDFGGNVIQISFQKGSSDAFYHHFTYDADQRLKTVATSTDGVNKTLQAKYEYYLHGPVKRIELAGTIQGIDYTYNIDGSLKAINNINADPGTDGQGAHASFSPDAFGMVLDYYAGDYQKNNFSTPASSLPDSYSGLVKSMSWISAVDYPTAKKIYGYTYDNLGQLTNANFGGITAISGIQTATFSPAYRESIGSYDRNGNILSVQRNGATGNSIANYGYAYEPGTNKLDKVNNNGALLTDYTYNNIGQTSRIEENGKVMTLSYTPDNLVKDVRDNTGLLLKSFEYDERGIRARTTVYSNGAPVEYNYFVHDVAGNLLAIYEQKIPGNIVQTEIPMQGLNRIGVYKRQENKYYYELKDHLGNVRLVLSTPYSESKSATYETSLFAQEYGNFLRFEDARLVTASVFDHTHRTTEPTPAVGSSRSQRLNGSLNERFGLARSLNVMPGDKLQLEVYAKYVDPNSANWTAAFANLIGQIAAGAAGVVADGIGYSSSTSSFAFNGVLGHTDTGAGPKAYLNWILFDKNYQYISGGYSRVSTAAKENGQDIVHEKLVSPEIAITKPGYAYVYLSNENDVPIDVYFDDFKVTQLHSPFVAGGDYYPFGLPIADRQLDAVSFRYGYQGEFSEKETTTNTNNFQLRMYDARFGRWLSVDPSGQFNSPYTAMGNNPVSGTDATGGFCEECDLLRASGLTVFPHVDVVGIRLGQIDGSLSMLNSMEGKDLHYAQDPAGTLYYLDVQLDGTNAYKYGNQGWEMYHSDIALAKIKTFALNDFVEGYHAVIEEVYMGVATGPLVELSLVKGAAIGGRMISRAATKGAVQYTKSSLQLGQKMHKIYKAGDVIEGVAMKEFRRVPGIRPDFVDFSTRTIYELKPFNPRAMQRGVAQLDKYKSLFQKTYGGIWKTILDTY